MAHRSFTSDDENEIAAVPPTRGKVSVSAGAGGSVFVVGTVVEVVVATVVEVVVGTVEVDAGGAVVLVVC